MRLVLLALLLIPSICFGGWSVKHYQVVEEGADYSDITYYHDCDALDDANKASGSATVTYETNVVTTSATSPMIGNVWYSDDSETFKSTVEIPAVNNIVFGDSRLGFYWVMGDLLLDDRPEIVRGDILVDFGLEYNSVTDRLKLYYRGVEDSIAPTSTLVEGTVYFVELKMDGTVATVYFDGVALGTVTGTDAFTSTLIQFTRFQRDQKIDQVIISNDVARDIHEIRNIINFN